MRFEGACEARYYFASREAFEVYEREHAPRLRAEGLLRADGRVTYARSLGEVTLRHPAP